MGLVAEFSALQYGWLTVLGEPLNARTISGERPRKTGSPYCLSPSEQRYITGQAAQAAVTKLKGGTPAKIQNLPPLVVTTENLMDPAVQKRLRPDLKNL